MSPMVGAGRPATGEAHRHATMSPVGVPVTVAMAESADDLAKLAAATFPFACPPAATAEDIADHVAAHLSADRFAAYLADPRRRVFTAADDGRMVGYTMLIHRSDPVPTVELSKMYVLPSHHGSGVAAALMRAGLDWAATTSATTAWLGVNQANVRAQRFYRKHGFEVTGTRTFRLGNSVESDFVMTRPL